MVGCSYFVEVNVMGAIVTGEPQAFVPFTNVCEVEVKAELLNRSASLVPEGVPVGAVKAS